MVFKLLLNVLVLISYLQVTVFCLNDYSLREYSDLIIHCLYFLYLRKHKKQRYVYKMYTYIYIFIYSFFKGSGQ